MVLKQPSTHTHTHYVGKQIYVVSIFTCCFLNTEQPYDIFSDPHLCQLAGALQVYSNDLNRSGFDSLATLNHIKAHIESHICQKLEEGLLKERITKQLNDLTMNALIPMDINDWCYDRLDEITKELDQNDSCTDEPIDEDPVESEPPPLLFSKDTVYHASLCSLFVSQPHLRDDYLHRHSFDEMSLSVSDQHKMFIARQGNIVYTSFNVDLIRRGLDHCVAEEKKVPIRYFCELLYEGKRLIFTGRK